MSTSPSELRSALAQQVTVTDDALVVDLVDGRTVSVALPRFPRLAHGTTAERANWRPIGRGEGIHWPDLDEDMRRGPSSRTPLRRDTELPPEMAGVAPSGSLTSRLSGPA